MRQRRLLGIPPLSTHKKIGAPEDRIEGPMTPAGQGEGEGM